VAWVPEAVKIAAVDHVEIESSGGDKEHPNTSTRKIASSLFIY
jgi:hypothetical protein